MTIIEFFDRDIIKNVTNVLFCDPDRMIMIGHDKKQIRICFEYLTMIAKKYEKNVELVAVKADRNNVQEIIEELEKIVNQYNDCVLDLTGGEDLYLVAAGWIMATHSIQCHSYDLKKKKLIDCDADGSVCKFNSFNVSVEDLVALHGGKLVSDVYDPYYREPWILDKELHRDVEDMWEATRADNKQYYPTHWNMNMTCIGKACSQSAPDDLFVQFKLKDVDASLNSQERRYLFSTYIMRNLKEKGIIENYTLRDEVVSLHFRDRNVKRIMTTAGQLLELRVAFALASLIDENGDRVFHDIRVGTVIDWDPESDREVYENRSVNEIDIVAMNGALPVFISCKNGSFDSDEIYKFNTVAELFGSENVMKIVVAADMEHSCNNALTLRERMDELGINRIEQAHEKGERPLARLFRGICGIGAE